MSVSEYQDFEQMARYAGSLSDGTDVEHTAPPYRVVPPLGDVVAQHAQELAALRERLAELEKYRHYMDAQYRTLSGYIATMGQELLDRIDLEAAKGSNFATFMGERFGEVEALRAESRYQDDALAERIAHLERLLHRAINCPHCTDDYGNEVTP